MEKKLIERITNAITSTYYELPADHEIIKIIKVCWQLETGEEIRFQGYRLNYICDHIKLVHSKIDRLKLEGE